MKGTLLVKNVNAVDRHGSNDNRKKSSIYFFILFLFEYDH